MQNALNIAACSASRDPVPTPPDAPGSTDLPDPPDDAAIPPRAAASVAPASLNDRRPPAPAWFHDALARAPRRSSVEVAGAAIECLEWGERGRPGLLLLHGNRAHADWYSFIAPFLADEFHVVATSWSGMGGSGWRKTYSLDLFVQEILEVAQATGMMSGPIAPTLVAHSFGGFPALACAARHGERLRAAVIVDTPILSREMRAARGMQRPPGPHNRPNLIYPTLGNALARFRLMPEQPCENDFLIDHIARLSLREATSGGHEGWTWRFDPFMWRDYRMGSAGDDLAAARCPVAFVWGARSSLIDAEVLAYIASLAPAGTPLFEIAYAHHHVMLDQPLPFVAALRALLAGWPVAGDMRTRV